MQRLYIRDDPASPFHRRITHSSSVGRRHCTHSAESYGAMAKKHVSLKRSRAPASSQKIAPDSEEREAALSFAGDRSKLGAADKCLLALSGLDAVHQRIAGFIFEQRFPPQLEAVGKDVGVLQSFCDDAQYPAMFKRVLEKFLAIGMVASVACTRPWDIQHADRSDIYIGCTRTHYLVLSLLRPPMSR